MGRGLEILWVNDGEGEWEGEWEGEGGQNGKKIGYYEWDWERR